MILVFYCHYWYYYWEGYLFLHFFLRGRFGIIWGFLVLCFPVSQFFCFSASLLALLRCLLFFSCFSAFCFPCFPCFSAFPAFPLFCFSAFVLLCLSTSTILHFLFLSHVFLLLYFLLLCFFASCLYCLFVIFFCFILFCLYPKWNPWETLGETQKKL